MSFVPYEHILGHDTPVYVGASTRLTENKTPPEAYLRGWSSFKLGKRKKSTSNLSITSSTQNDLEHAASHTTASPSRLLKRNTGPLTFTAPSARASAGPEHEAGSPHYSSPETGAHRDIDAPGHPITHQSGDIEMTSSTDFGGPTSSPAPQGKESNVMSPPQAEPSLQHTNNLKSQEEPLDDTGTKVENFVGMHPQRYALFQSQDREQAREPGHKRDLKITGYVQLL